MTRKQSAAANCRQQRSLTKLSTAAAMMRMPLPNAENNNVNVNVTLDSDKVKADAEIVKEKAAELTGRTMEAAHDLVDQASEPAP